MNEIKNIQITDLVSAPDNPFKVTMDAEMERQLCFKGQRLCFSI